MQLLQRLSRSGTSDVETLFGYVTTTDCHVHVIVDVGAQILDYTNMEAAKKWLTMLPKEKKQDAVVYFNDDDDLCVIDRRGVVERLQTSPYAGQLDRCLVFLDQAHTRGTGLRLPDHYRAAVTLGPDLTKDRLVQGKWRNPLILKITERGLTIHHSMHEDAQAGSRPVSGILHLG